MDDDDKCAGEMWDLALIMKDGKFTMAVAKSPNDRHVRIVTDVLRKLIAETEQK